MSLELAQVPTDTLILMREAKRRREQEGVSVRYETLGDFLSRTFIKRPNDALGIAPFDLWPAQAELAEIMRTSRLLAILKARQLGISWLAAGLALKTCLEKKYQSVLILSKGQTESNDLADRVSFLYKNHLDRDTFPALTKDGVMEKEWANESRVISLPATKDAGRSFTGSLVIMDEWAFMRWPKASLQSVKPCIDAGGQIIIISSADAKGTDWHQHVESARNASSPWTFHFLPWTSDPSRDIAWRERKIHESAGDAASVLREYPNNPDEAFTYASGLVYEIWRDDYDEALEADDLSLSNGNVSEHAEYVPDGGPVYWGVDDGYEGKIDPDTGSYTGVSHPRTFLLMQLKSDGHLDVFYEDYACKELSEQQIERVMELPYAHPDYAAIDKSAAELRGRLRDLGVFPRNSPSEVTESIKEVRRFLAPDINGWRRVRVHPRCRHLRFEMVRYRLDGITGKPVKEFDHGPDALRYLIWKIRGEIA